MQKCLWLNGLTLSHAECNLCRICVRSQSAPVLSGQEDRLGIRIYFQVVDRSIHHILPILVHHMTRVRSYQINSEGLRQGDNQTLVNEKESNSFLAWRLFLSFSSLGKNKSDWHVTTNEKRVKTLSQVTNRSLQGNRRFWIPLHGFRIPDSLSVELGFRIPIVSGSLACAGFLEPYSGFQSSGFLIPQQKSPGFRNLDSLTWDDTLAPAVPFFRVKVKRRRFQPPSPTPHFFPQKLLILLILRLNKKSGASEPWVTWLLDCKHESSMTNVMIEPYISLHSQDGGGFSPPQRPFCVEGRLGERKKKAREDGNAIIFTGIPSGSLCRGERGEVAGA